jgi:hypothetical protein
MLEEFFASNARNEPGSTDWGIDTIAPMLLTKENYDGEPHDFVHYGKATLISDGQGKGIHIQFGSNKAGYDAFVQSMSAYGLDNNDMWQQAYALSSQTWNHPDIQAFVDKNEYFTRDDATSTIHFITSPHPVILLALAAKTYKLTQSKQGSAA